MFNGFYFYIQCHLFLALLQRSKNIKSSLYIHGIFWTFSGLVFNTALCNFCFFFCSTWSFILPSLEPYRPPEHGSLHSAVPQRPGSDVALFWRLGGQRGSGQSCAISQRLHAALQPQAFSKTEDSWTVSCSVSRAKSLEALSPPTPISLNYVLMSAFRNQFQCRQFVVMFLFFLLEIKFKVLL